jgi:hypothetical protein
MSRSRLPLPPVPASGRPVAAPPVAAPPVAAPPADATPSVVGPLAESLRAAEQAAARRKRVWADEAEPVAAAPAAAPAGIRTDAPAPRVPRQTAGASDARYGDWTKPSRSGDLPPEEEMRAALAPSTTLIPERSVTRRDEDLPDIEELVDDAPAPREQRSSAAAPVGGRAAQRAQRQAAEAARQKAVKDSGVIVLDEPRRAPRRVARGLVAMGVVALGVLGVYQFTSPQTDEAAATQPTAPSPAPVAPVVPLPELDTEIAPVEPVVTAPVRVPFVVLNSTSVSGLAAKISDVLVGGGWEAAGVGAYEGDDVAVTTVFFTEGDETQRQAAVQLVDQFKELSGPAPRFFELPADVTAPGLVVVAAGDWTP